MFSIYSVNFLEKLQNLPVKALIQWRIQNLSGGGNTRRGRYSLKSPSNVCHFILLMGLACKSVNYSLTFFYSSGNLDMESFVFIIIFHRIMLSLNLYSINFPEDYVIIEPLFY